MTVIPELQVYRDLPENFCDNYPKPKAGLYVSADTNKGARLTGPNREILIGGRDSDVYPKLAK